MNFRKRRTFIKCLSALVSSVCVFQQPSVFAETLYEKGSDGVYTIKDKENFNKLITNLPYNIKWKMVIDADKHNKGKYVFDENRQNISIYKFNELLAGFVNYVFPYLDQNQTPGHLYGDYLEALEIGNPFADERKNKINGEPGYLEGMLNLWEFMTKKLSDKNWEKINSDKLQQLHDIAMRKISDKLVGYENAWFPIGADNSSYKGLLESFAAKKAGFQFEQKVSEMLLKSKLPEHKDVEGNKVANKLTYGIDYVGKWDEINEEEQYSEFYSLSGALPTLDMIRSDNMAKKPMRERLRLNLTYGNTGLGKDYVDKAFKEFYDTLEKIKSDPLYELPALDLYDGYTNYTNFLREKFCTSNNRYDEETAGMFKFLEEEYNKIKKQEPYVSKSKNEKIIELIVRFCRALDQAHVFPDGNIRTYRMLENMLLMQNGILPAQFNNFNALDCCSVKYLVNEVKIGQRPTVKSINNNKDKIKKELKISI